MVVTTRLKYRHNDANGFSYHLRPVRSKNQFSKASHAAPQSERKTSQVSAAHMDMVKAYYDENQIGGFVRVDKVCADVYEEISSAGAAVRASKQDLAMCLYTVCDEDYDGLLSFGELARFFALFFLSEHNFVSRLVDLLGVDAVNMSADGFFLDEREAEEILAFVLKFYNCDERKCGDSIHQHFRKSRRYISHRQFAVHVLECVRDSLFVKW